MTDLTAFAPTLAENDGFFERRLWPLLKRTFLSLEIGLHTRQSGIRIVEFTRMHLFAAPPAPSERVSDASSGL
jgi:hypothetical protein